jgi:hypothetical protein
MASAQSFRGAREREPGIQTLLALSRHMDSGFRPAAGPGMTEFLMARRAASQEPRRYWFSKYGPRVRLVTTHDVSWQILDFSTVRRDGWWRAVSVYAELFGSIIGSNWQRAMIKLKDDERPALEELARHPDGHAQAPLVADGFTVKQLAGLVIDGFATLQRRSANVDGRERSVLWMQITEAGRSVITK